MVIFGAGLSGLIAGVLNQNAQILEPFADNTSHQALLRFRSKQIGEAVGIPFKEIEVYKGIWDKGDQPISPHYIIKYSRKVTGTIAYRSIRNTDSELRWIAPLDFQEQLKEICKDRITYAADPDIMREFVAYSTENVISTIPMLVLANMIPRASDVFPEFEKLEMTNPTQPIYVNRFKIPGCNVYMTYYYPDLCISLYRASISKNMLIVESMFPLTDHELNIVNESLGISSVELYHEVKDYKQMNGKINPIDEKVRRAFIHQTTIDLNVYSLGRFAVWKNLLLDDVYKDILRIKEFMNKDKYEHHKDY